MSKSVKILLALAGSLLVLCLCVALAGGILFRKVAGDVVKSDPAAAMATARSIADFSLPPGYEREAAAFDLMGVKMAVFSGGSGQAIMFIAMPAQGSAGQNEQIIGQMRSQMNGKLDVQLNMTTIGQRPVTVRGRQAQMTLREGRGSNGARVREGSVSFTGKSGPAIITIIGPTESWDQRGVERFLASLR